MRFISLGRFLSILLDVVMLLSSFEVYAVSYSEYLEEFQ